MKERVITLPTAKLAKEKGFDLKCGAMYGCDDPFSGRSNHFMEFDFMPIREIGNYESYERTLIYPAPTQNLLLDWLRIEKNIYVTIDDVCDNNGIVWFKYACYKIVNNSKVIMSNNWAWDPSYEEAIEAGLQFALYHCTTKFS